MKTKFTKQIVLGALITFGLFSAAKAQTAYDDQQYSDPQYNNQQYNNNQQYSYNQPQQYQQPVAAPAPNDQQSFYYYPNANVYYDVSCNRYIYNNGGSWLSVNVLPANIYLGNSPRFTVYHRGPQVWLDNAFHVRNYYRPAAYRQPIVAYNNYRHDDFGHRDFGRTEQRVDVRRDAHFDRGNGNRRW
jgi:hypothetical protein